MSTTDDIIGRVPDELREAGAPRFVLPQRLIDTIPDGQKLVDSGDLAIAPDIDGWEWDRPTVIAGKRYDWWMHKTSRRLRLAPSLLDAIEGNLR